MSRLFVFQTVFRREKTQDKRQEAKQSLKKRLCFTIVVESCCRLAISFSSYNIVWSLDLESYGEDKIFIKSTGIHCLFAFKKCDKLLVLFYIVRKILFLYGNREMCLINKLGQQRIFVKKVDKKRRNVGFA